MNVACPGCQTRYSVDDGRIPPSGVTIECPKCHHSFVVKKDGVKADPAIALGGKSGPGAVALPGAKSAGGAVALPGTKTGGPSKPPPAASSDSLDLGLDLDDFSMSSTKQAPRPPPPRSAPPPGAPSAKSQPIADSGMLEFIDQTAQKAGLKAPGPGGSELRVRRLNGHVEGPYGTNRIVAMLRAGELEGSEEVSEDGRAWRPITAHPELAKAAHEAAAKGLDLTDLPGPVMPRDLPGLPDPHRNLPAPADLPGRSSGMRNLPAPADLPQHANPMRNLPAPGDLPQQGSPNRNLPAPGGLPGTPNRASLGPRGEDLGGPALGRDDDPMLDLDTGAGGDRGGGSKVTGMTAEEAAAFKRSGSAAGAAIDPSLLELGDVPKMPGVWETYKKPILAFVAVLAVFLIAVVTEIFTPVGAFGYKAIVGLFAPPPPPPPPAPPPAPAKLVDQNESQQLIHQASFEGLRSVVATLKKAEPNADNLLLYAKAQGLAALLYGKESFSIEDLQRALKAAEGVDPSKVKSGNPLTAKNELIKARAALGILEGNSKAQIADLSAALEADNDDREIAFLLGLALLGANEKIEALKAFDRALVIDAKYAPAMHAIGEMIMASSELGTQQDAVMWFEKAIDAEPTHVRSALVGAQIYEKLGRPGAQRIMLAKAAAEASRGLPPSQRAETLFRAAQAFDSVERVGQAASFAPEAARLEPANSQYVAMGARALAAAGKGAEAAELLSETLKRSPEDAPALLARAEALMAAGEVTKAFQDVLTARRVLPKSYEPYLLEGRFNASLGKLSDARDALTIAQKYAGNSSPRPLVELGRLELEVGNIDVVFQHANAAVSAHPVYAPAHALLGDTFRVRTQLTEAIAAYEKALELDPESAQAEIGLANALRDLAAKEQQPAKAPQLSRAMPLYLHALERDPKNAGLIFEYGRALEMQGEQSRALELYRDAISIDEKDPRPQFAMIRSFMEGPKPNLEQAKEALKAAEKVAPLEPDVGYWKARIAFAEGRFDDAHNAIETALRVEPKNADYHYWNGRIYDATDSIYEAVGEYELAVQLNSRLGPAYRALGKAAISRNRFDNAREHFANYRKAVPDDPSIWVDVGQSWFQQQKNKEAMDAFQKALAANPKNAEALDAVGTILALQGEDKKAVDYFRRATQADETLGDAWCHLGQAIGPEKKGRELSKDAQRALTKCLGSDNADQTLKAEAKQMLAAAGLGT